jgi:hypothetical protein
LKKPARKKLYYEHELAVVETPGENLYYATPAGDT